mmetsp:Transcript_32903/g.37328  ORF Transcript_32903/g.37328 Transcript_32903/m.37328 type:complete len:107 (-) Transcript_32903:430-750(-)
MVLIQPNRRIPIFNDYEPLIQLMKVGPLIYLVMYEAISLMRMVSKCIPGVTSPGAFTYSSGRTTIQLNLATEIGGDSVGVVLRLEKKMPSTLGRQCVGFFLITSPN